jgi:hypothetical protein
MNGGPGGPPSPSVLVGHPLLAGAQEREPQVAPLFFSAPHFRKKPLEDALRLLRLANFLFPWMSLRSPRPWAHIPARESGKGPGTKLGIDASNGPEKSPPAYP